MKCEPYIRVVKEWMGIHKKNEIDIALVIKYIQSFHLFVSHYRRKISEYMQNWNIQKSAKRIEYIQVTTKICSLHVCLILKDTENESVPEKLKYLKLKAFKSNLQYKEDSDEANRLSENSV